jgi:hypothetical protein
MHRLLLVAVLCTSFACTGCSTRRNEGSDDHVDRLWRQGYGYKNPNPERVRQGLPPLNFDGSEHK